MATKFTTTERDDCHRFRREVMPEIEKVLARFGLTLTTDDFETAAILTP